MLTDSEGQLQWLTTAVHTVSERLGFRINIDTRTMTDYQNSPTCNDI